MSFGRISSSYKGNNFCDFLFVFLHSKPLLKRGLLTKENICSQGEQILSFKSRTILSRGRGGGGGAGGGGCGGGGAGGGGGGGEAKMFFDRVISPENVSILLNIYFCHLWFFTQRDNNRYNLK